MGKAISATQALALELTMHTAPVDYAAMAERLLQDPAHLGEVVRALEGLAVSAAECARYFDERHGGGCGDQGHERAVKALNRVGRLLWVKGFGYNAYHERRF